MHTECYGRVANARVSPSSPFLSRATRTSPAISAASISLSSSDRTYNPCRARAVLVRRDINSRDLRGGRDSIRDREGRLRRSSNRALT